MSFPVALSLPLRGALLRRRWLRLALPLLALSLLIGGFGAVAYRYLSEEIRRETHRTLAVIAEQKRQHLEGWLAETRLDAQFYFSGHSRFETLYDDWLAGDRRDPRLRERMQSLLGDVMRIRGWDGLVVFAADGQPLFGVGDVDSAAVAPRIAALAERPRIEFIDLHRDSRGVAQHGLLVPIGSDTARPRGFAAMLRRADRTLYPLVESWPVPTRTAETYLVRRDGDAVRFLTPLRHRHDPALSLSHPLTTPGLPAARAAQGEAGILAGGRDYRSVPVLAYAAPVGDTPWLMLAEIDEEEAYAGVRAVAWGTALAMSFGLLLVYAGAFLLWRRDRQRRAFAELQMRQAAEARFRVVFEQAPLGVTLVDSRSGRILEANRHFAAIVGRPADALAGCDPMELTHPDDLAASREFFENMRAGRIAGFSQVKRYLRPDGSPVWASVTCAAIQVGDDAAPRNLAIVEDISERRRIEERLRISEARHRLLADNAIDVILTMDLDGRFSYVSPSVERLRGYRPEEVLQQTMADAVAPGSLPLARAYLDRLHAGIAAGQPPEVFRGELELCCKDGSTVWTDVTASPLFGPDGSFVEILGVTRDISERRRHELELQRAYDAAEAANAAKSEFLAHMSHEIRTPMNAVLGLAQVLEREPLAPAQRDMVGRIRTAGQSLLAILNDILDLSKIEAGQLRIEPRAFDLGVLLAHLDSLMGQAARAKGLDLRIAGPTVPPGLLHGDGLRLEQILFNLTGNAIKFTEQGEVAVEASVVAADAERLRLRFEVRDSGIGIAPEALARLFAPFTQADAGIGRRFGGTGLGLSICKRLVELMGGEIGAESEPESGSCFWFELPFGRGVAGEVAAPPPVAAGPRLVGAHLLVVDDSAMNRDLVERALRLEGATATLAADGRQAVQILESRPAAFDAVLMDVQMPVMDGLAATRTIRTQLGLTLPVIAFTAGVRDDQQAAARAAGADDVLAKPMDIEQMAQLLARWIRPRPAVAAAPAAARPAPDAGDFPEIAGIDRERAAQRLGGDRTMFLGLLELFVEDNATAADQARAELAAGERERAARRLHTLRSNAGFIGATALMETAGTLEKAIGEGEDGIDGRLVELQAGIDALVAASAAWR